MEQRAPGQTVYGRSVVILTACVNEGCGSLIRLDSNRLNGWVGDDGGMRCHHDPDLTTSGMTPHRPPPKYLIIQFAVEEMQDADAIQTQTTLDYLGAVAAGFQKRLQEVR